MQTRLSDLLPRLNERDRRLAMATEAKSWGRGGISAALGSQHRQEAGVGAEAGAVLADVGIGAGALDLGADAEPAGQTGLDRGVGVCSSRRSAAAAWRGRVAARRAASQGVLWPRARWCRTAFRSAGSSWRDVPEQRHQRLQRHPGVDQGGGICYL